MSSTLRFPAGVPPLIRRRGEDYFRHRAASLVDSGGTTAEFTVRGTRPYRVTLTLGGDILHATCDCPYAADRDTVCKHIWAALLEAKRSDALPDVDAISRLQAGSAELRTGGGLSAWEETIALLAPPEEEEKTSRPLPAALVGGEVVYVLDEEAEPARGTGPVIRLLARARKQNGAWARPRPLSLTAAQADSLPREDDRRILALLGGAGSDLWSRWAWHGTPLANPARLHPEAASVLLPALCETGRFFLEEPSDASVPLAWDPGEPWRFGLVVDAGSDGKGWLARGALQRDDAHLELAAVTLVLGPGFLLSKGRISRFAPAGVHRLLRHLAHRDAIEVAATEGVRFVAALLAQHPRVAFTVPEALQFEECGAAPRPEIRILESRRWVPSRLCAHLSFDYEGRRVASKDAAEGLVDPDHRRLLRRDREAEAKFVARLHALGFRPPPRFWSEGDAPDFELSERHLPRAVRTLLSEGWRVEAENLRYRAPGRTSLRVASGVDWFEVQGEVDFEEQVVALPALLRALRDGQGFVALGDGTFGLLPEEWLRRHARLAELGRLEQTGVRFAPAQVAILDALLSDLPEATWDATFARARERLGEFTGIPPRDPARAFRGTLRPYQRVGLGWLQFLREFGFGGCLADDMGLGKTVQVLALLSRSQKRGDRLPSLVVVPRSLVFNWKEEAARFAPHLRVLDHTGLDRPRNPADLEGADVVLTTYGTLRRDAPWLAAIQFDYAILDEAQAIKNARSQAAKAARLLRARHRLALSGTPIENHLGELWSLFEFLNPGMLGASPAFRLGEEALRHPEGEARTLLARALRPFVLRRTKAQVAPELPARTDQTLWCTLGEEQRTRYDELKEHYRSSLLRAIEHHGIAKAKIHVLEALLRLRQAACHPGLLDPERRSAASAKLEALLPHLSEVVEAGHKVIVFSQFTGFLALLRPLLEAKEIPYAYLDGQTRAVSRKAAVSRFQEDAACPVFLISLKAGGLGLNLTAAEYVYLLDPWWNPAVEAQAVDRAHRIGQTRPVFAYRLVARDTVEEKILELQAGKRALADAILGEDAGLLRKMTREDVERLLG